MRSSAFHLLPFAFCPLPFAFSSLCLLPFAINHPPENDVPVYNVPDIKAF
jgi:hypothetical protein